MPIKPGDIVIARFMTVLIYNLIEAGIIIIPFSVVFAVLGGIPLRHKAKLTGISPLRRAHGRTVSCLLAQILG